MWTILNSLVIEESLEKYHDFHKNSDLSLYLFHRYCEQLKLSESTHVLQPFLPSVLEGLVQLAAQFSSEVLTLVMETLCIVCTVDSAFTTSAENKICPLTIAIFLKYSNGKIILKSTASIFCNLDYLCLMFSFPFFVRSCCSVFSAGHLQGACPDWSLPRTHANAPHSYPC